MIQNLNVVIILLVILNPSSKINCQETTTPNTVRNSRMTKLVEKHSENIRRYLCKKGEPITPEQWANLKSECINPRLEDLMPENTISAWEQCSEKVVDLCDDDQWMEGKGCAKEMLKDEDVSEIQSWYDSRVGQMAINFQIIKSCYAKHKKSS